MPTRKAGFILVESKLERDFARHLDWLPWVRTFKPQPLKLEYEGPTGDGREGVPDFLVEFDEQYEARPVLCDVTYRSSLGERWPKYKVRLRAALVAAIERGWDYCLITDGEIQTEFLGNLKFLSPFLEREVPQDDVAALNALFAKTSPLTPAAIVEGPDPQRRSNLLKALWALIAQGVFSTDLDRTITMRSKIWRTAEYVRPITHPKGRRRFLQRPPLPR